MKVGTKVVKDGFEGTVIEICDWTDNLCVVRLRSGTCCVPMSDFDGRYENSYIVQ